MGKKCGELIKLKQTLQRFVFVYYIPLAITIFTAFKLIMLFVSLEKVRVKFWVRVRVELGLGLS